MPEGHRVFTFRGEAYQVAKDKPRAIVTDTITRIVALTDALEATEVDGPSVEPIPCGEATRISSAAEWIGLTLSNACHDYLNEALRLHQEYVDSKPSDTTHQMLQNSGAIDAAVSEIKRCYAWRDVSDFDLITFRGVSLDYKRRVKADLEARLRGEPGKVELP